NGRVNSSGRASAAMHRPLGQPIADAMYGVDQLRLTFGVNRVANDQDMAAQGSIGAGWIIAPHGSLDLLAGDHTRGSPHQLFENPHARGGEGNGARAAPDE